MLARYTYCLSAIVAVLQVIASPERVSSLNENVPKMGLGISRSRNLSESVVCAYAGAR